MMRHVQFLFLVCNALLLAARACGADGPDWPAMFGAAESGFEYAMACLRSNAPCFASYPLPSDFEAITAGFSAVASNSFPGGVVLASFSLDAQPWSPMESLPANTAFPGCRGRVSQIAITVAVAHAANPGIRAEIAGVIESRSFSVFDYGVFADGDLVVNPDTAMRIDGPVHANGVLSLGTQNTTDGMRLTSHVTCASNVYNVANPGKTVIDSDPYGACHAMTDMYGEKLDSAHPFWKQLALVTWQGRVQSWEHGVVPVRPLAPCVTSDPRLLIDPPPQTNESADTASARFAGRAAVRILESGAIEAYDGPSTQFVAIAHVGDAGVSAWLATNRCFWNNTISNFVTPLDIDVGGFTAWAEANAPAFNTDPARAGILYVSLSNKPGAAVRLTNGASLPCAVINGVTNGFMVVTANPLYLRGHYNVNTECPACVMADSVTVLSSAWDDDSHLAAGSPRGTAGSTRYLTSIVTGQATNINADTAAEWFGGIDNLPKRIEHWQSTPGPGVQEIRGTICPLWPSKYELNNMVVPGDGPDRTWWFEAALGYPPGAPRLFEFVSNDLRRSTAPCIIRITDPSSSTSRWVGAYVTVSTECSVNARPTAAQIGYGAAADGAGWIWTPAAAPSWPSPSSNYYASAAVTPAPGAHYIAARWMMEGKTNAGWSLAGETNATALCSTLQLHVTNTPEQLLPLPWDFAAGILDGVAPGGAGMATSLVSGLLSLDGFSHSQSRDDASSIVFTLATAKRPGVSFFATVRRDETGPARIDLDYFNGSAWNSFPFTFNIDQAGEWYAIGGRVPGSALDTVQTAQFRVVGYAAAASELDVSNVIVTTTVPEPGAVALVLACWASVLRIRFSS